MSDSFDNMRKMMREFKKNNQHDLSNEGTNIDRNFQEKLENTENTQEIEVQMLLESPPQASGASIDPGVYGQLLEHLSLLQLAVSSH